MCLDRSMCLDGSWRAWRLDRRFGAFMRNSGARPYRGCLAPFAGCAFRNHDTMKDLDAHGFARIDDVSVVETASLARFCRMRVIQSVRPGVIQQQ